MSTEEVDLDEDAKAATKTGTYKHRLDDGTVIQLPTEFMSVTQLLMMLKCPAQYEKRYVEGIKTPPGIALIEGSSGHDALEFQNAFQILRGRPMPLKKVLDRYGDVLAMKSKEVPADEWRRNGENKDTVYHRGVPLLTSYMQQIAPKVKPSSAEQHFKMKVKGVPFQGFIDLGEDEALWDYKFCSPTTFTKLKHGIGADLQLTAYSMGAKVRRVGLIPLIKGRGEVHMLGSVRTKRDYLGFEDVVVRAAKAISAGSFTLCLPDAWYCSPKWCGYWSRCRGRFA